MVFLVKVSSTTLLDEYRQICLISVLSKWFCACLILLTAASPIPPSWKRVCIFDYDIVRKEASAIFYAKVKEVQSMVSKLLQTQRAAEQKLDKYIFQCASRACVDENALNVHRYEKTCTA